MNLQFGKLLLGISVSLAVLGCDKGSSYKTNHRDVKLVPSSRGADVGRAMEDAAPSADRGTSANTRCAEVGEGRFASARPEFCGGIWNIYASISGGSIWYQDKMGSDPQALRIDQQAVKIQNALAACGIQAEISLSDWFDSFTPDLVVVHSHPHASKAAANSELSQAKACGVTGYAKTSRLQVAGRD